MAHAAGKSLGLGGSVDQQLQGRDSELKRRELSVKIDMLVKTSKNNKLLLKNQSHV